MGRCEAERQGGAGEKDLKRAQKMFGHDEDVYFLMK